MQSSLVTPGHLVVGARLALLPCLAGLTSTILVIESSPGLAGAVTFLTAILLLQAAPKVRAADMLGLLALFATMLEWGNAAHTGAINAQRWQAIIAVTGAMALLLKVQHLRSLARQDPYVPLRQLDRRNALLRRSTSTKSRADDGATRQIV